MQYLEDFLMLNLEDYGNVGFPLPIGFIITATVIALCAAVFIITYRKRYTVMLLRSLIRHKATSEESAKTLAELRLSESSSIRRALSRSGQITYIVKRAGEVKPNYDEYVKMAKEKNFKDEQIDFAEARFYICDEKLAEAKTIVEKTNASWLIPSICAVLLIAVWVLAFIFLPDLLELLNKE